MPDRGEQTTAADSTPPSSLARLASSSSHSRLMLFFLLLGIALRVWASARDTSLYLDEGLLSWNILELPLSHLLTKPLMLDQVAPRGFLLIERTIVSIFGSIEFALRFFPFACGITALLLFRRLAERVLSASGSAVALLLFAIGVPLIRFGAEVKQYECDLLAAVVLFLLALRLYQEDASTRRAIATGFFAFLVIWFSQASVLVMAGIAAAIASQWLLSRDAKSARALSTCVPLWALASLIAVFAGLRSMAPSTRQFMHEFWAGAFLPLPFHWRTAVLWVGQRFVELSSEATLLRYPWPGIYALLTVVGIVVLWKQNRLVLWVLFGPLLVALAAAIAQQYPWRGRLAFWMLPSALLAAAAGLDWFRIWARRLHPFLSALLLVGLSIPPVIALAKAPPPYDIEHHRDILSYLQRHRQPGDLIYVVQLQQVGVHFYASRYNLQPDEWVTGVCDPDDSRSYLRDVDRFRGVPRLWVLVGSGRPLRPVHGALRNYLATIGVRREAKTYPSLTLGSVSIELYDLSDPSRLAAATADTFPIPPMPRDPRIACRAWTNPDVDWQFVE